jgi:hypothetical protein
MFWVALLRHISWFVVVDVYKLIPADKEPEADLPQFPQPRVVPRAHSQQMAPRKVPQLDLSVVRDDTDLFDSAPEQTLATPRRDEQDSGVDIKDASVGSPLTYEHFMFQGTEAVYSQCTFHFDENE